uniref:Uncharacterized protein n=1 Tax=Glossina palpalis gambiensis TaxID=67801 RepID=A0A1B0BDD1_9MUSC
MKEGLKDSQLLYRHKNEKKIKTLATIPVKGFDSNIETRQLLNFNCTAKTATATATKTPVIDDE